MRVLLDECVDRRLARDITGHDVTTVPQMGWATIKNGDLLALAEDRNVSFQQNLPRFSIAVVVLRAQSNRLFDLGVLVPQLLAALPHAKRGEVTWVGG